MPVPISNVTRRQVYAPSGTGGAGPYAFTFEILANTDIAVYKDDVLLTLTTHYTVTINANGTGSVTITATGLALSPTSPTQYAIVGNRTISRTTDFTTGGDFFANTLNDELDQQTIFAQQNSEGLQRALQAPQTDPTTVDMTLPRASVRANKTLAFDSNGDPTTGEVIGDNRGNWSTSTAYNKRDIVKDTSNGNIYYANTSHTSTGSQPISTNADSAKWDLIVDNASAGASATAAAASASAASTSASNASTSASNASTSATNAAASASTASTQASNASTSATNAASSASSAASSASSATSSASTATTQASNASTSASNASTSASNAATSATNAATSATTATTQASNASTSATNASNSATSASTSASTATTQATNASNSATSAATSATNASNSATAASTSATNAANSETAAANSATTAAAAAASGMYSAVQDKSANYTVVAGDAGDLIRVTTTSGAVTITLPTISTVEDGFKVAIVKWTGDANAVTVNRSGSDTINGATSSTIGSQYSQTTFVADFQTNQWFAASSGLGASNVAVDAFSGNNSTTAFTLSGDPGSENNTQVFVSGVYQEKDTYSVSGTTLTFSTAPPTGTSNIEVVWTAPLAIGTPSDGTVTTAKIASSVTLTTPTIDTITSAASTALTLKSAGTTAVTIDTSQRVGIGVTSPAKPLSVYGADGYIQMLNASTGTANGDGAFIGVEGGTTALRIVNQENDAMSFHTNGLANERMRIDSSGNVGIGTSSPISKLNISTSTGTVANNAFVISNTNVGGTGGEIQWYSRTNDGTNTDKKAAVITVTNSLDWGSAAGVSSYMAFSTINANTLAERMRINSSGQAIVGATSLTAGTTTANCLITVGGTASPMMKWQSTTGPHAWDLYTSGGAAFYFGYDGSDKATINSSTGAYTALSDRTKKKDFEDSSLGLNAVLQLKPTLYRMLDDADDAPKELGFIAQDVKDVIPQAYVETTGQNGTFIGLNFNPIVATLTKAIQELKAINDQQAETINALTARVVALEGK